MEPLFQAVGGKILQRGTGGKARGVSTDSRTLRKGELFFALRGPRFDGHQFITEAIKKQAWGAIVEKVPGLPQPKMAMVQVRDALTALGNLAQWWRARWEIPCVAITGSNGKTTTKEMVAAILAQRWKVLKTEENFNNLIGLPLTVCRLDAGIEAAVLEMGMNAAGEIRRLTEIARPTVGVITNVAPAHLEKLGSVEAVAQAKGELFAALSRDGIAVYNAEDPWVSQQVQAFPGRKVSFGIPSHCDVCFQHMEADGFDRMRLKLSVRGHTVGAVLQTTGIHNVMNALAACAAADALGFSPAEMQSGLENFVPMRMRFEQIQLANGVRLINDAYNANPLSMAMAFEGVARQRRAGRFVAVLGDMKELGESADALHQEIGAKAAAAGVQRLFLIGEFAASIAAGAQRAGLAEKNITIAEAIDPLVAALEGELQTGDIVLVKASRAMQLERVVEELKWKFGL